MITDYRKLQLRWVAQVTRFIDKSEIGAVVKWCTRDQKQLRKPLVLWEDNIVKMFWTEWRKSVKWRTKRKCIQASNVKNIRQPCLYIYIYIYILKKTQGLQRKNNSNDKEYVNIHAYKKIRVDDVIFRWVKPIRVEEIRVTFLVFLILIPSQLLPI